MGGQPVPSEQAGSRAPGAACVEMAAVPWSLETIVDV